jgi:hypothetical protein
MEVKKTLQGIFDKSLELSKIGFEKAKEAGAIGLKQIEIKTIEHKIAKKIGELGTIAFDHFTKEKTSLEKESKGIPDILKAINNFEQNIKEKEKELKDIKKNKK